MRGLRSFLVLLVVAAGLGAYIYFVEMKRTPSSETTAAKEKAFTIEGSDIQQLEVMSEKGERTKLARTDGAWQIVEPVATPADETEVSSLASSLSTLEVQRVVEDKPSSLVDYGLETPRVTIAFTATGANAGTKRLLLGRKTPTGGDMYAKVEGQERVFLVQAYLDSTFNRGTFDLRDKHILKFDRSKVDALEIQSGDRALRFVKQGTEWAIAAPLKARADFSLVEGVIGRLDDARMSEVSAPEASDLKPYGLDKPGVTVRVGMGSSQAMLAFGKTLADNDRVYARDLARPMVFALQKSLPDDLGAKTVSDFRRRDLFEFRPFTASRFELTRGATTYAFEKTKAQDGTDKWTQTAPATREPDATKMESLLSAFANLRAQSFEDQTSGTGLDTPAVVVSVTFGESDSRKQERVSFGQTKDAAFAAPQGEPGAAKIDATELANALKALDELIKS